MIPLKSPIETPSLIGFTVLEITDRPPSDLNGQYGYVNASVRLHYSDGSTEDVSKTLWDGADKSAEVLDGVEIVAKQNSYSKAGQWTDDDAQAKIVEILSA